MGEETVKFDVVMRLYPDPQRPGKFMTIDGPGYPESIEIVEKKEE